MAVIQSIKNAAYYMKHSRPYQFIENHWQGLLVLSGIIIGVLFFFYPPLLVSGFAFGLAMYPAFGAAVGSLGIVGAAAVGDAALVVMSALLACCSIGVAFVIKQTPSAVSNFCKGVFAIASALVSCVKKCCCKANDDLNNQMPELGGVRQVGRPANHHKPKGNVSAAPSGRDDTEDEVQDAREDLPPPPSPPSTPRRRNSIFQPIPSGNKPEVEGRPEGMPESDFSVPATQL